MYNMKSVWYDPDTLHLKNEQYLCSILNERRKQLKKEYGEFYIRSKIFERIYQYRSTLNDPNDISVTNNFDVENFNYLTFNLVRACCNSAHNKIAKLTPKVTFLPKDASRNIKETAKKLDEHVFRTFKKTGVYKSGSLSFLDSLVTDVGALKIFLKDKGVGFEKITSAHFWSDNAYSGSHEPSEVGEDNFYDTYQLCELFPNQKQRIKNLYGNDDRVMVCEIYKGRKKQAIFTDKLVLQYCDWDYPVPYELLRWTNALNGVLGISLAHEVFYIQQTITYILHRVLKSIHLFAVPRVFMQKGSQPTEKGIGNMVAEIIEHTASQNPPQFVTPPVINKQVLQILQELWQKGFEVTGLGQLQAHGQVPQGLKQASGTALRTYNQIESERFQLVRKDYEQFYVRLAKKMILMDNSLPKGISKDELKEAVENCTVFASNILPETPAGRQALVSEMYNSQLITRTQALTLIDSPDTNKLLNSESARFSAIEIEIERAIKSNKMPDIGLASALGVEDFLDIARKYLARVIVDEGSDHKSIAPLISLVNQLTQKISKQAQEQAEMQEQQKNQPLSVPQ